MELWIAEVFDYYYEAPILVGTYDTEEKAQAAINIVIKQVSKSGNSSIPLPDRFVQTITPVQLNGFTPAVMDWLSAG